MEAGGEILLSPGLVFRHKDAKKMTRENQDLHPNPYGFRDGVSDGPNQRGSGKEDEKSGFHF